MDAVNAPQIGIVVPTLGTRPEYLNKALRSIRAAGYCHVVVVAPDPEMIRANYTPDLIDQIVEDPKSGLADAINAGIRSLPSSVRYANWLGDDDLLAPQSLAFTSHALENSPETVCVFGGCSYIGPDEDVLWVNKSGKYAKWLMRVGPQLIPQPGLLFTVSAFNEVGGLDSTYKWAFDLDLLLKFSKHGKLQFLPKILSSFRWHDGSLSVGGRHGSVSEASKIRRSYLPRALRGISPVWEFFVRRLILVAGVVLSRRSRNTER
jgi:glycosyltransferase involved in cell wall biosynthesis